MTRRLTDRQARFCTELVTGITATEAARRAGYAVSFANREAGRLVDKPQIAAHLAELRAEIAGAKVATATERAELWSATLRSTDVPWRWRLKASELLARSQGDFAREQQRVRLDLDIEIDWDSLTDTELKAIREGVSPLTILAQRRHLSGHRSKFPASDNTLGGVVSHAGSPAPTDNSGAAIPAAPHTTAPAGRGQAEERGIDE